MCFNFTFLSSSTTAWLGNSFKWSKFWSIKGIAPRVRLFTWRALHDGLAVGSKLNRIFRMNGLCWYCNSVVETVDHVLMHCQQASVAWHRSTIPIPAAFQQFTLHNFCLYLLHHDEDTFRLGCSILWILWKARNDLVFNDKCHTVADILYKAQQCFNDYKSSPNLMDVSMDTHLLLSQDAHIYWSLPPPHFIKVNVDGAWISGKAVAGAIARDHQGNFVGCLSKTATIGSSVEAEAQAFLVGIDLIIKLNIRNVILEGDAKVVVESINNSTLLLD